MQLRATSGLTLGIEQEQGFESKQPLKVNIAIYIAICVCKKV